MSAAVLIWTIAVCVLLTNSLRYISQSTVIRCRRMRNHWQRATSIYDTCVRTAYIRQIVKRNGKHGVCAIPVCCAALCVCARQRMANTYTGWCIGRVHRHQYRCATTGLCLHRYAECCDVRLRPFAAQVDFCDVAHAYGTRMNRGSRSHYSRRGTEQVIRVRLRTRNKHNVVGIEWGPIETKTMLLEFKRHQMKSTLESVSLRCEHRNAIFCCCCC